MNREPTILAELWRHQTWTVYASNAAEALGLEERPGTFIHLDHIPLKQPSGEPLPDGERLFPDPRPRPAAPATAETCEALQRSLDAEIDGLLAQWLAAEPKEHLFRRSTTRNRELETKVNDLLPWWKKLLTHLECRGDVCYRVPYLGRLPPSWWELTRAEEAALRASAVQTGGVERYMQLTPRKRRR